MPGESQTINKEYDDRERKGKRQEAIKQYNYPETTGTVVDEIEEVKVGMHGDHRIYNISGQQVGTANQRGVYIVNGKRTLSPSKI